LCQLSRNDATFDCDVIICNRISARHPLEQAFRRAQTFNIFNLQRACTILRWTSADMLPTARRRYSRVKLCGARKGSGVLACREENENAVLVD